MVCFRCATVFSITLLFFSNSWAVEWIPIQGDDLRVKAGSALDFSNQFLQESPLTVPMNISAGHLDNGGRFRALCANMSFTLPRGGFPSHAHSDEIAKQLKMQGYNWVEVHMLDAALMAGRNKDFDFDPEQLDRFHYLLAALKKEGIYWQLDLANTFNVSYGDVSYPHQAGKHFVQLEVYFDEDARGHWLEHVQKILLAENPYTNLKVIDDPGLARLSMINENALSVLFRAEIARGLWGKRKGRINRGLMLSLENKFKAWLSERYGSLNEAVDAWREKDGKEFQLSIPESEEATERMADTMRFFSESGVELYQWMEGEIRKIGYQGMLSMFNNGNKMMEGDARQALTSIAMHSYHDHPRKSGGRTTDGQLSRSQSDNSSLEDSSFLGNMMLSRQWGKPFLIEEYDHVFPNRWRREAGVLIPAYASYQDWDSICRFASPLELGYGWSGGQNKTFVSAFKVGLDPVARVGERLAALLFRRGDVDRFKSKWSVQVDPVSLYDKGHGWQNWPRVLQRVGLSVGIGVTWPKQVDEVLTPSDVVIPLTFDDDSKLLSADMKKALGTEFHQDIYVTDTGQIKLHSQEQWLTVVTDRSEVAVFNEIIPDLRYLQVKDADTPALVSVSSLDIEGVSESRRLLLMVVTDAHNSGMVLESSSSRTNIVTQGVFPVRVEPGSFSLVLENSHANSFSLYALDATGARVEQLPIQVGERSASFSIALQSLENGPSFYYELVADE